MAEPLFNRKTLKRQLASASPANDPAISILRSWASTIRDGSLFTQSETEVEDQFKARIVAGVLDYRPFNDTGSWTVASKAAIGSGAVDLALGQFTPTSRTIVAPFELKGARTRNLDAIMPGRAKSPVQQAWEYATDNVGTKWVLVSNYLEIRLYSYAEGRSTCRVATTRRRRSAFFSCCPPKTCWEGGPPRSSRSVARKIATSPTGFTDSTRSCGAS